MRMMYYAVSDTGIPRVLLFRSLWTTFFNGRPNFDNLEEVEAPCTELEETRFLLFVLLPRLSSVTIDAEFVGERELLEVLLVAVDAVKFRMSLVCRFPMASSACVAMRTRRISVECLRCWQPSLFECCLPAAAMH